MRKKIALSLICVLLVCVLLASLTACMKIGMKQNSVETRLKEAGASVTYPRTTPITKDARGYVYDDFTLATKTYTRAIDGEDTEVTEQLYIFFCGNDETADWTENACKAYVKDNEADLYKWNCYRYDRVVMCGYYELIAIARNY